MCNVRTCQLMVFTVTSSDCRVKKAWFYEFLFTLGWRLRLVFHWVFFDFCSCRNFSILTHVIFARRFLGRTQVTPYIHTVKYYIITTKQDKAIFLKAKQRDNHPLKVCLPQEKNNLTYNLRRKSFQRPKINTERYKNTFVNRLIFKYNLLWYFMSDMCN